MIEACVPVIDETSPPSSGGNSFKDVAAFLALPAGSGKHQPDAVHQAPMAALF